MKRLIISGSILIALLIMLPTASSAKDGEGLTCADFPTKIDVPNSIFGDYDSTNFDGDDDGVGCEDNSDPITAYDLTQTPPQPIHVVPSTTTTVAPSTTVPTTMPPATPPAPVVDTPTFTG